MRMLMTGIAVIALMVACGCRDRASVETKEKELTLVAPGDVTIARGETEQITVKLDRKNFPDDVKLKFENLPSGVALLELGGVEVDAGPVRIDVGHESPAIKGDKATYTLKADADAALVDDSTVTVSTKGPDDKPISVTFKVTVKEKS